MRILHVISSISVDSGGPARSSQGLVAALEQAGVEAYLLSFTPGEQAWLSGVKHFMAAEYGGWQGHIEAMERAIEAVKPDLIHIHAIWMPCSHAAAVVARKRGIPYVIAPRGMLEPWSLQVCKWKKRLAMWLYQRKDLKKAVALHATALSEAEQFRRLGFRQTCVVSPNGVNLPSFLPEKTPATDGRRRVLFVSRIHPKKGLLELVEAWDRVRPSGWVLEIAGTDADGYQKTVEEAVARRGLGDCIRFLGSLSDDAKWPVYRNADFFVLPTYSENFGIVIAEALYAATPVVTTKGTPWQELEECRCGLWIDCGVSPLADALKAMIALSDKERLEMGCRGARLIEEKYTWPAIGQNMCDAYVDILRGCSSISLKEV